jgi:acyl-CoA synthetase (NDP forming)
MWHYSYNLKGIYETPSLPVASRSEEMDRTRARHLIDEVRKKGRTILTEFESKQIFAAYGIPDRRDAPGRHRRRRSARGRVHRLSRGAQAQF